MATYVRLYRFISPLEQINLQMAAIYGSYDLQLSARDMFFTALEAALERLQVEFSRLYPSDEVAVLVLTESETNPNDLTVWLRENSVPKTLTWKKGHKFPRDSMICGRVMASKNCIIVPDTEKLRDHYGDDYAQRIDGVVGSFAASAIMHGEQAVGVLKLASSRKNVFRDDPPTRRLVRVAASTLASTFANHKLLSRVSKKGPVM